MFSFENDPSSAFLRECLIFCRINSNYFCCFYGFALQILTPLRTFAFEQTSLIVKFDNFLSVVNCLFFFFFSSLFFFFFFFEQIRHFLLKKYESWRLTSTDHYLKYRKNHLFQTRKKNSSLPPLSISNQMNIQ